MGARREELTFVEGGGGGGGGVIKVWNGRSLRGGFFWVREMSKFSADGGGTPASLPLLTATLVFLRDVFW